MYAANSRRVAVFTTQSVVVEDGSRTRIRQAATPATYDSFQTQQRVVLISRNRACCGFIGDGIVFIWYLRTDSFGCCGIEVSGTMCAGVIGAL